MIFSMLNRTNSVPTHLFGLHTGRDSFIPSICLSACDLLSSYLSNIRQRVQIKGSRSEWREVKKEYPRAQFLAPCFFNDMFPFVDKCSLYYEDDKSILLLPVCS